MPVPRQLTALVIVLFFAMCPVRADMIQSCPLAQGVEEHSFGDGVPSVDRRQTALMSTLAQNFGSLVLGRMAKIGSI
jgi:hypothetical protein